MSNGNSFSWLAFLLGLAIGLWISVVVLFLVGDDDDECCYGPGGTTIVTWPIGGNAWVPGGDGSYLCTNDDEGSAIVMDEGGAIVMDEGSAIVMDEGGAIVMDEGSAIVMDQGGFVPAPGSDPDQLGGDREFQQFRCATNNSGGAMIRERTGRRAVVSMPNKTPSDEQTPSERCGRRNGHAVVVNEESKRIEIDEGGAIVMDEGPAIVMDETADPGDDQELDDDSPMSESDLAYCMVAKPDSKPIVIRPPSGS